MSYRHFRAETDQAEAEALAPDRFDDGAAWRELAERARKLGASRLWDADEWQQITGMPKTPQNDRITAGAAWALLPKYTAARLAGNWVTLDGLAKIAEQRQRLYIEAPTLRNPEDIRGSRLAIYVLDQAETDPDRRASWVKLAQENDLLGIAMYRPAKPIPEATLHSRLSGLRPGTCVPITEAERLELTNNPIEGTFIEPYKYPKPGGWHVCRGTPSRVGFGSRF